jgi:hypothetical protein
MNTDPTRNWTATYVAVLVNEALVILCLWLFSRYFIY